jgi:D-lactate dehydrogenase
VRIAVFSTKPYDRHALANAAGAHALTFYEPRFEADTAPLAAGHEGACVFVNDTADAAALEALAATGVRLLLLRATGFNNVDVAAAARLGIAVGRVPAYSPHAVAEHTLALILALNRKIHRAYNRVREGNFALDGLLGFDMVGKTVAVVGTGAIGAVVARILLGFGCTVLADDIRPDAALQALGVRYAALADILPDAHVVTLHCPLTPETHHMIDGTALGRMRKGVMLINTSRGALVDTRAVIAALKSGRIGALGLDVYEEEGDLFFENLSGQVLQDDVFARLLTFPNVVITGHQAFFTAEAVRTIAETTIANADAFAATGTPLHPVRPDVLAPGPA